MRPILDTIEFFHAMRSQMRFGKFSRLPIHVHRFEVKGDAVECDWLMRPPDPWDVDLSLRLQQEIVLADDRVEPVIEAIIQSAYTGEIGDGKIFLYKADDAIRIRNRDRGEGAL